MKNRRVIRNSNPLAFIALAMAAAIAAAFVAAPSRGIAKRVSVAATASPTPVPVEDPAVTKIARQQFLSWQAGMIDRKDYTPDLSALITPDKLSETSTELGQLGAYVRSEFIDREPLAIGVPPGSKTYLYRMYGTVSGVYMQFTVTQDGKVASLAFRDSIYDFHPTPSPPPTPSPTPEPVDTGDDSGFGY